MHYLFITEVQCTLIFKSWIKTLKITIHIRSVDKINFFDKFWFCRGKFGEVKKCKEKKTGRFLAAKFIAVNGLQERDDVINEVDIMKTLQHPRLLQLYDAFEKKDTFCIVTELWVIWTLKKSFFSPLFW